MRKASPLLLLSVLSFLVLGVSFAQESREIRKTVALNSDGRVSIETYKGSITITTWDKAEVDIYVKIEADDNMWEGRRDEEEKVRDTEIRIEGSGREVRIKSDYERLKRRRSSFWDIFDGDTGSLPFVHYTITMPKTASLKIKDYKSETSITDLKADLSLNTYKGDVKVSGIEGGIDLETYKGEVRVEYASMGRSNRFETYKGEIEIVIPRGKGFELDADITSKGDLRSDFDLPERYRSKRDKNRSYRGSVNGGGPMLHLETYKGTYRLRES